VQTEKTGFAAMDLSEPVLKAIASMGFEEPTPIQRRTIPTLLGGTDLIGQAQTGTGKTAAFGIPLVEKIEAFGESVQALVLVPTRELAIQVAEEINGLGRFKGIHALPVYGGTSIERQIKALKRGVHVVVGTPGRVIDHIERRTLKLSTVRFAVLDEADEMLDMGFLDDIKKILARTPEGKQMMLYSATMPAEMMKIADRHMKNPVKERVAAESLTASKVSQIFYEVKEAEKIDALTRLIDSDADGVFLVFCHTKRDVDEVTDHLKMRGYGAEGIHGDFDQSRREAVLNKFKRSAVDVLVATDVAARGLDISHITHVVNYSIPQNPESYVHRVGRTGRAGRSGVAITFVTPREERQLRLIKKVSKADIRKGRLPSAEDVVGARFDALKEKVVEFKKDRKFAHYLALAHELAEEAGPAEAVAALLKFQIEGIVDERARNADPALDETGASPGMARLFITVGREQGVTAPELVRAISQRVDIPSREIKGVCIFDAFAFVEVPRDSAERVIEVMHKGMISGRKIVVAPARPREGGMPGPKRAAGR